MARATLAFFAFNRGIVSRLGAARQDIKRLALGAKTMTNWVTRALGSMNIRPGLGYIASTRSDAATCMIPFVFSLSDKALVELTANVMRVWIDDAVVVRPTVSAAVTNGTFDTDLSGWTDDDDAGATSSWATGGYMQLVGSGTTAAKRTQAVAIGAYSGTEHALRIVIQRGPVVLRVGSTAGDDDYISETTLQTGAHSLRLVPTGTFYIRFQSTLLRQTLVSECSIEAAGDMVVATPWGASDLDNVRWDASGDVLFVACKNLQQYRIERRAARSWSVVKFYSDDGPYRLENVGPITLTPSVTTGNGTLTASMALFKSTNVGSIFSVTHVGQRASVSASAANTFTSDEFNVDGTGTARAITIEISGTFVATITLQRSTSSASGPWIDVSGTWTAPVTTSYNDGLDNQETWYRIGVKTGDYTSGTVVATISIGVGTTKGVARVTAFTSSTVVDIEVLSQFAALTASDNWAEGLWSDRRGWPSAVSFHEGRLWWGGKDKIAGSVSDAFDSNDPDYEGDAGPINRSIGSGPVDSINWMVPLQRLVLGGEGAEFSCRSTSLDEPLTPTNFNLKPSSTQGSAAVRAIKVDSTGIFVQRGGIRVYELAIDAQTYDYGSTHLTAVCPEIGRPGFVRCAFQRQPEPRWHGVRSDGTVAMLAFDKNEQLVAWCEIETDGDIEDVVVLPGDPGSEEDQVYYVVKRTINSATKRYLERFALETNCRPNDAGMLDVSHLGDSYILKTAVGSATITGLSHLEGEQVVVWADGVDISYDTDDTTLLYTVTGGQITVDRTVTNCMVGLPYTAQWQSTKLLQMPAQSGTVLNAHKNISNMGMVLADTHAKGLRFGRAFTTLDDMPSEEFGQYVDEDTIYVDYEEQPFVFPGDWGVDERLCLEGRAPRPVTVVAITCDTRMNE